MAGQNLVPRLLAGGHRVIALDRNAATLRVLEERAGGVEFHVVDLAEDGAWSDLFRRADAVVDLKAQITSPDLSLHERNNTLATERVVDACSRYRVPHLIHLSSSVVISKADDFYTRTKRRGEAAVRGSNVPHTILRPPLMFGPGDVKHLGLILKMMRRLPVIPLPGDGRFMRQPLYVGDLCGVIERALERGPKAEIFNVIGHERIMFIDLLREIRRVTAARCVFVPVPISLFGAAIGIQRALSSKVIFTKQQLDALTAGDDFPVEDWSTAFGVPFTPFWSKSDEVYGAADDLRLKLLAALSPRRSS